ncbi:MAG: ParB N-terminal domain-containing protein [Eubacterium sp.]|nr:ParB N-terminal domain-containing protein [Eubacterium sp.]
MATDKKIDIFNEDGERIGSEPLWSEDEVQEYFTTRKIRDPNNHNRYYYPPEKLNPYVLAAHKQGLEFKREMVENKQEENNAETAETKQEKAEKADEKIEKSSENIFERSIEKIKKSQQKQAEQKQAEACPKIQTEGFKTQCSNQIELTKLSDFPLNRFPLYEGAQLNDMVESIKNFGVLTPLVVWKKGEEYVILSGHNRKRAAELAGLKSVPVCIKENLTEDEANIIMGETNFRQRGFGDLKHSQKAFCLKQHYTAMKNQGIKNDVLEAIESQQIMQKNNADFADNSAEKSNLLAIATPSRKSSVLGNEYGLDYVTVSKYIRIADLCTELLNLLDEGYIAFSAAYQLTFIDNAKIQKTIAAVIKNGIVIDASKACKLREYFEKHKKLTEENIKEILAKRPKKGETITIKPKEIKKFFTNGENHQQIKDIIFEMLEMYYSDYVKQKQQEQKQE